MKVHVENTSPAEEKQIRGWMQILAEELDITDAIYSVHIHVAPIDNTALMIPIPTPDKRIFIQLNINKKEKWLASLSHEMVHVKQVVKGETILADPKTGLAFWRGEPYNMFRLNEMAARDYDFYRSLPWEQEAFNRMHALARIVARRMACPNQR